jgi:hypothetical protein
MKTVICYIIVFAIIYTNIAYIIGYYALINKFQTETARPFVKTKSVDSILQLKLNSIDAKDINFKISVDEQIASVCGNYLLQACKIENGFTNLADHEKHQNSTFFKGLEEFIKNNIEESPVSNVLLKLMSYCYNSLGFKNNEQVFIIENGALFSEETIIIFQSYIRDLIKPPPNLL